MLVACSKDKNRLEYVPAKSEFVASVDIDKLLSNLGVKFDEGEATETLASEKLLNDYLPLFVELHKSCNLSEMIAFSYKNKPYFVLEVTEMDKLKESLMSVLSCSLRADNGFDLYECPEGIVNVAVNNNICWIIEKSTTISDIKTVNDAAESENMSDNHFITEYINYPASLNIAVGAVPGYVDQFVNKGWVTCRAEFKQEEISLEISRVDSVGVKLSSKGLTNLMPSNFLNYLPSAEQICGMMAVGINGMEIDWQNSFASVINMVGVRAQGMLDYLLPFLVQIDGPVALGIALEDGMDASDLSLSSYRITGMVHMNPNGVRKALQTINSHLSWFGNRLTKSSDGSLTLDMGDYKAYAGSADNYLIVSNSPIEKSVGLESLSTTLAGECKGGLYMDIKSLRDLGPGFPEWGIKITGQYRDDILRMTLKLSNSDKPILQALLDM